MKKRVRTIVRLFFTVLSLVFAANSSADLIRDRSANIEISPVITPASAPAPVIALADPSAEKISALPPAETSPPAAVKELLVGEKQDAAIPASPPPVVKINDKNTAFDTTYHSNGTALKAIERNVTFFKERIREKFSVWLERSARYVEIMKDILKEKGLPEDLVFLPIVESGFNPNAYSRARAVGPWQFIAATGKRYGLVIDWWRDERKDPVKSTQAAASYLKDLYKMFGSWNLALAAYNAGEGRISKALKRSDVSDYWELLDTSQIRTETKEYVPRYIAATLIAGSPEEYGFNDLVYHKPLEYDEVIVHSPLDIEVIAQCSGSTIQEIRELNPELRRWSTPFNVKQYTMRIPAGSREAFEEKLAGIPKGDYCSVATYKAKSGDTVKRIAKKTGMPVAAILAMNSLTGIEEIRAGHELRIPPKDKYSPDLDDRLSAKTVAFKKGSGNRRGDKKSVRAAGKHRGGKQSVGKDKRAPGKIAGKAKGKVKTTKA